jgi:hypothetical protein
MHFVPDDANLDDTLLQHCQLLDEQISSFAVVSIQNIALIWHLTVGASDINIQSLADICKLASLQSTVGIGNYLWDKNYFWYGLSPKLIKNRTTSLKPDGFCMY